MCRNIKQLRQTGHLPSEEEIYLAALQYVRKVSGYRKPSSWNPHPSAQRAGACPSPTGGRGAGCALCNPG